MDTPASRPNILHLGGITLADFVPIEDVFDAKVLEVAESDEDRPLEALPFASVPTIFTSVKAWPFSTNLRCWNCVFTFDASPCFVPTFVRTGSDDNVEIGVEGNFCTFNCAARYIDDTYPPQAHPAKHWRMRDNLCLVYNIFKNHRVRHILPAPRKTELVGFGGELDEDAFWGLMRELDPQFGLRDHRPGTVVPERLRTSHSSVWDVCAADAEAQRVLTLRSPADFAPLGVSAATATAAAGPPRAPTEAPKTAPVAISLTPPEAGPVDAREDEETAAAADACEKEEAAAADACEEEEAAAAAAADGKPVTAADGKPVIADDDLDALLGDLYDM